MIGVPIARVRVIGVPIARVRVIGAPIARARVMSAMIAALAPVAMIVIRLVQPSVMFATVGATQVATLVPFVPGAVFVRIGLIVDEVRQVGTLIG